MDRGTLTAHGLVASDGSKAAPRGTLTREELGPLLERQMTVAEIAERLDRSPAAVRYWLEKLGLKPTGPRGRRPAVPRAVVDQAIKDGIRTLVAECRQHGNAVFVVENSGRARCRQCRMDRVSARRRKVKRMLIEEAGGACVLCGYDRYSGALHFHHLDPSTKRFGVSKNGATVGIDRLRVEASKCAVLCANCHAEVEVGFSAL